MKNKSSIDTKDTTVDWSTPFDEWLIPLLNRARWCGAIEFRAIPSAIQKGVEDYVASEVSKATERANIEPKRELAQLTPTALSSIETVRRDSSSLAEILEFFFRVEQDPENDFWQETSTKAIARLEAHIAEHYVPKAEVQELDELDKIISEICCNPDECSPKKLCEHCTNDKQRIEALIQDAVTKNLEKDVDFLKEMHTNTQRLVNGQYDLVTVQHIDKMVEDWLDVLKAQLKGEK